MFKFRFTRRFKPIFLLYFALVIIIFIEFIIYFILPFKWNTNECVTCVKILLVADPQILGRQESNLFERWDSDRFLYKTFHQAVSFTEPDIVIFMGDLMNEGHISNDEIFYSDLSRFFTIFSSRRNTTVIYLPGDNDIGGEESPVIYNISQRFEKYFGRSRSPWIFGGGFEIYQVNGMDGKFDVPKFNSSKEALRIVISHVQLLDRLSPLSFRVISKIDPLIIFSAHKHTSVHVSAKREDLWERNRNIILPGTDLKIIQLEEDYVNEIIVPTCSYRMDAENIGYGFAELDVSSMSLRYSVLWLPSRLLHLYYYCALGLLYSLFILKYFICCVLKRRRRVCLTMI